MTALKKASSSMVEQDRKVAAVAGQGRGQQTSIPLEKILQRTENTRELNDEHLASLAESIGVLGLLEPLVVDQKGRLLAGGHRLAAIQLLKKTNAEVFDLTFVTGIPVRTLPFDASTDSSRALAVEVAENEHRRDYTRDEAVVIADRLRAAGYKDTVGRPKKDEKALAPALQTVMGKSLRTVRRLLAEDKNGPREVTVGQSLRSVQRVLLRHVDGFGRQRKGGLAEIHEKMKDLQQRIEEELEP